jgi:hypothetical protein
MGRVEEAILVVLALIGAAAIAVPVILIADLRRRRDERPR